MNIQVIEAKTKEELGIAFKLRFDVFGGEGYLNVLDYPGGRECDSFDTLETTVNFLALDLDEGKKPVGAARAMLPNDEVAKRMGWDLGLPMEELYDFSYFKKNNINIIEHPRNVVIKDYRGQNVILYLHKVAYQFCMANGTNYVCGAANTETKDPKEMAILYHYFKKNNLIHNKIYMERKIHNYEPDLDEDQLERLVQEREIRLPTQIRILTSIGSKITGNPLFLEKFNRYTVPLVQKLDEISEPVLSFLKSP